MLNNNEKLNFELLDALAEQGVTMDEHGVLRYPDGRQLEAPMARPVLFQGFKGVTREIINMAPGTKRLPRKERRKLERAGARAAMKQLRKKLA